MACLADQINQGEKEIYILLSSSGGMVAAGVTLHNYIRSLPVKVIMHNIGLVDSVANVVFLAGSERYAVPHSSFLFHGVGFDITQQTRFEEKQLKERILSIDRDQGLIGEIIAENSKLSLDQVKKMFLEAKTLTPTEAKSVDLIQAIKEARIPSGAKVVSFVF
jgi:ATP-dependent protease ClpP protease subunit